MIKLGFPTVSLYPNTGITIENHGGTIIFHGICSIGNNSYISISQKGIVEFGDNFCASTTLRLTSYDKIVFRNCVRCGWDTLIMDTDFHKLGTVVKRLKLYNRLIVNVIENSYLCVGKNNTSNRPGKAEFGGIAKINLHGKGTKFLRNITGSSVHRV